MVARSIAGNSGWGIAGNLPLAPSSPPPTAPLNSRAPTIYDDLNAGNTTSTVWQYNRRTYTPQAVTQSQAVWFQGRKVVSYTLVPNTVSPMTGYVTNDTVTMSDGSVLTVTAAAGVVTSFSVTTYSNAATLVPTPLTQTATSGVGAGMKVGVIYTPRGYAMRPGDVTTPLFAGGLVALVAGYTGLAIRVNATVATVSTDTDINILADGNLDIASYYKACEAADPGTFPVISRLYNQMDAGATYAAQSGSVAMPYAGQRSAGDVQLMAFGQQGQRGLALPSVLTGIARNALSVHVLGVADAASAASGGVIWQVGLQDGAGGHTGAALIGSFSTTSGATGIGALSNWARGGGFSVGLTVPASSTLGLLSYVSSTAGITAGWNENLYTDATNQQNQTLSDGGFIGMSDAGSGYKGFVSMAGIVVWGAALTATQQVRARRAFYTSYNLTPQVRDQIIPIGPSLLFGNATYAGLTISQQLGVKLGAIRSIDVINPSVSGMTIKVIASDVAPKWAATYRAGARNIALICGGDNDLVAGDSVATVIANLQIAVATMAAAGFTTIVLNEPKRSDAVGQVPHIDEYRALINAGASGAEYVVDPLSNAYLANANDPTMYPDGIHWSSLAGEIVSELTAVVAGPLLA